MIRNWVTWVPARLADCAMVSMPRRIVDQDAAMLIGQQDRLDAGARPWSCPVDADRLAVAYRRWRTRVDREQAGPRVLREARGEASG